MLSSEFKQYHYYTDGSNTYKYIEPDAVNTEFLIFENTIGKRLSFPSKKWNKLTWTNPYQKTGGLKSKRLRWSSRWSKKRKSKLGIKSIKFKNRKSRKQNNNKK
jgi:hypothetical protein